MQDLLTRLWHEPVLLFTTIAGLAAILVTQNVISPVLGGVIGAICLFLARQSVTPNAKLGNFAAYWPPQSTTGSGGFATGGNVTQVAPPDHDPDDPAQHDPGNHA